MTYLQVPGVGVPWQPLRKRDLGRCLLAEARQSGDQNLSEAVTETQLIPLRQPPR